MACFNLPVSQDVLEKALASGRFKELVTISFAIIAIIALVVFAIIQAIKSWLYRIETDPIVYHAWRIAQFYQDRIFLIYAPPDGVYFFVGRLDLVRYFKFDALPLVRVVAFYCGP